ncbi:MerR family transcriptional regulator [Deferrisoma palaeochoriense]
MEDQDRRDEAPLKAGELYTIKEVSELTDVPVHTIRLWDRKLPGFLAPHRTPGGQRRFTRECIERVRKLDYFVNEKGLTPVGARRRIEEGAAEGGTGPRELREAILADRRVRQAIDEIVELIRKKILEGA